MLRDISEDLKGAFQGAQENSGSFRDVSGELGTVSRRFHWISGAFLGPPDDSRGFGESVGVLGAFQGISGGYSGIQKNLS